MLGTRFSEILCIYIERGREREREGERSKRNKERKTYMLQMGG